MKLQDIIDVLVFKDELKIPLKIYQPNVDPDGEPEHLIEFLVDEHKSVKDVVLNANIALIQIGKSTAGSVSKPIYDISVEIILDTRVIV